MNSKNKSTLFFVYNIESWISLLFLERAKEMFFPKKLSCDLVRLTYKHFRKRKELKSFLLSLPFPYKLISKKGFVKRYPAMHVKKFPGIYLLHNGTVKEIVSAVNLKEMSDIKSLIAFLSRYKN